MRWLDGITNSMKSEKGGLKINIQKTKNVGSGSMRLWQIDGENVETVTDFRPCKVFWQTE